MPTAGRGSRVLLLNPPASANYFRDYYLCGVNEPDLCVPPQDLATLSGTLSPLRDVLVIDAVAEGLSPDAAAQRAAGWRPDAVVFLSSSISYAEDTPWLGRLRSLLPDARFIGTGDFYREVRDLAFSLHSFLDAALLDFTSRSILEYCRGRERGPLADMLFVPKAAQGDGRRAVCGPLRPGYGLWSAPAPLWELFPLARYRIPFTSGEGAGASLLTDFGCPYLCTYCPASALGYKLRDVGDVIDEAKQLAALGVRNILIRDQSFGAQQARTLDLLDRWIAEGLEFSWVCSTRADLADPGMLERMRRAGCRAVIYGIDTGSEDLQRSYKKNIGPHQVQDALRFTRDAGLKSWGFFLLGTNLDTRETIEETLAFARSLPLDRISFRVDTRRRAADWRRDMLVRGLLPPEAMPPDVPTASSIWQGRLGISDGNVHAYYQAVTETPVGVNAAVEEGADPRRKAADGEPGAVERGNPDDLLTDRLRGLASSGDYREAFDMAEGLIDSGPSLTDLRTIWSPWWDPITGSKLALHKGLLTKMIQRRPDDPWPRYFRGTLLCDPRDFGFLPRADFDRYGWMYFKSGWVHLQKSRFLDAEELFKTALRSRPLDWKIHGFLAETYLCMGQPDRALRAVAEAQRAAGDSEKGEALAWRGLLLLWGGRYEAALPIFDDACDKGALWAFGWRGGVKVKLGRLEEALRDLDRAIELYPQDEESRVWRAEAYRLMGRYQEALRDLSQQPPSLWVHFNRALVCATIDDRSGTLLSFRQIPGHFIFHIMRKLRMRCTRRRYNGGLPRDEMIAVLSAGLDWSQGYRRKDNYGNSIWKNKGASKAAPAKEEGPSRRNDPITARG